MVSVVTTSTSTVTQCWLLLCSILLCAQLTDQHQRLLNAMTDSQFNITVHSASVVQKLKTNSSELCDKAKGDDCDLRLDVIAICASRKNHDDTASFCWDLVAGQQDHLKQHYRPIMWVWLPHNTPVISRSYTQSWMVDSDAGAFPYDADLNQYPMQMSTLVKEIFNNDGTKIKFRWQLADDDRVVGSDDLHMNEICLALFLFIRPRPNTILWLLNSNELIRQILANLNWTNRRRKGVLQSTSKMDVPTLIMQTRLAGWMQKLLSKCMEHLDGLMTKFVSKDKKTAENIRFKITKVCYENHKYQTSGESANFEHWCYEKDKYNVQEQPNSDSDISTTSTVYHSPTHPSDIKAFLFHTSANHPVNLRVHFQADDESKDKFKRDVRYAYKREFNVTLPYTTNRADLSLNYKILDLTVVGDLSLSLNGADTCDSVPQPTTILQHKSFVHPVSSKASNDILLMVHINRLQFVKGTHAPDVVCGGIVCKLQLRIDKLIIGQTEGHKYKDKNNLVADTIIKPTGDDTGFCFHNHNLNLSNSINKQEMKNLRDNGLAVTWQIESQSITQPKLFPFAPKSDANKKLSDCCFDNDIENECCEPFKTKLDHDNQFKANLHGTYSDPHSEMKDAGVYTVTWDIDLQLVTHKKRFTEPKHLPQLDKNRHLPEWRKTQTKVTRASERPQQSSQSVLMTTTSNISNQSTQSTTQTPASTEPDLAQSFTAHFYLVLLTVVLVILIQFTPEHLYQ